MTPTEETRHDKWIAIVTLYNIGKWAPEIHRELGFPKRTIRGVIGRYNERGHVNDAPRSGRPAVLGASDGEKLVKACENKPAAALHTLSDPANAYCCPVTVDKTLRENGLTQRVKRAKPWFKKGHKPRRLEWCNSRRHWKQEWRKCVWTDECKIEYNANPTGQKVRYRQANNWRRSISNPHSKAVARVYKSGRPHSADEL